MKGLVQINHVIYELFSLLHDTSSQILIAFMLFHLMFIQRINPESIRLLFSPFVSFVFALRCLVRARVLRCTSHMSSVLGDLRRNAWAHYTPLWTDGMLQAQITNFITNGRLRWSSFIKPAECLFRKIKSEHVCTRQEMFLIMLD